MNDKAEKLIDVAYSQLGSPYVFGTWGQDCTTDLRKRYASYNPSHTNNIYKACQRLNGSGTKTCDGCKYKGLLAFDCRGFTYWCLKQTGVITLTGSGATEQYNTAKNWDKKGTIKTMPDLPCIVFQYRDGRMQHTGVYVGNGMIVHASTGVIESRITSTWTHFAVPKGLYTAKELKAAETMVFLTIVKRGNKGEEVKKVQTLLTKRGYYNGTVSGTFDAATQDAVKIFQRDFGLDADGVVGTQTWQALMSDEYKTIVVITKNAKTYAGDNSKADQVGTVKKGDKFTLVAASGLTTYYGFRSGKNVIWVAGKYAKLQIVKK